MRFSEVPISYDEKVGDLFCDGKASSKSSRVIVTMVKVSGSSWLKVERNEYP
ncbi:MAG: hypothetical protein ACI8XO_001582 [Verrucomicrobiales bacterium]|jgi:hypothetical protein